MTRIRTVLSGVAIASAILRVTLLVPSPSDCNRDALRDPRTTGVCLVFTMDGAKIQLSEDQHPIQPAGTGMKASFGRLEATEAPLAVLAFTLAQQLGEPVIDKTGLAGLYDLKPQWTPELVRAPTRASGPSIFTALQEQLGVYAKGRLDVLVVDSFQKPTRN